jgi:hypothetical protein
MRLGLADNGFEALDLRGEGAAASRSNAVVAAAGILLGRTARGFGNQALVEEFFEIVVESARAESVLAAGLPRDLLHEAVAVAVFGGESEKDVLSGGGERGGTVGCHSRDTIYRTTSELSSLEMESLKYAAAAGLSLSELRRAAAADQRELA